MKDKLTDKQKQFCNEYLIDCNATRSYMKVYNCSTENSAAASAVALLRNPKVKEFLDKRREEKERIAEITQDKVLAELAKIGFDPKLKLTDRIRALELVGKTKAMFTDKTQLSGKDGEELVIKIIKD